MDEIKWVFVGLAVFIALILSACFMNMKHIENMADKGFCQTWNLGSDNYYWSKCK